MYTVFDATHNLYCNPYQTLFKTDKNCSVQKMIKTNYLSLCLSLTFELWMDCIHNAAINNATNVATEVTPWTLNINEKYFTLFVLVVAY